MHINFVPTVLNADKKINVKRRIGLVLLLRSHIMYISSYQFLRSYISYKQYEMVYFGVTSTDN